MPFIQEVSEDKAWTEQGLVILTVNVGEESSQVEQFMEHFGLSFPVALDKSTSVAKNYNIRGIPTTFFIDKNGIIKDMKVGAFLSRGELDGRLENLMLDG
jgi:peroxiredoxin